MLWRKLRCSSLPTTRNTSPAPISRSTAAGSPKATSKPEGLGRWIPSASQRFSSSSDKGWVKASMPTGALEAAESPALSLRSMSKSFGPTRALENVDLLLRRGEVVALLGANGAGKSTLAKIASGVVEPDHGQISINGRPVRFSSPRSARESGVVTVHQATDQLGVAGISVAQNLVLDELCGGSFSTFAGTREIKHRAAEVAALIGLDLPLDEDCGTFGPAQRQLIAIARAIAAKASVLILDEPTASLGAAEADRLFDVVDRLRSQGVAILYISHRMGDIRRLADRVVVLRNGRQVFEQRRPLDLAAAIRQMVDLKLSEALTDRPTGPSGEPVLRLDQVQLRADSRPFDLEIRAGEIIAVTGALGSGKSNLLGALFGLRPFVSGRATLDGGGDRGRGFSRRRRPMAKFAPAAGHAGRRHRWDNRFAAQTQMVSKRRDLRAA